MVDWKLVLLGLVLASIGTVIMAPLGWLLERMRFPEKQKQGGLPRFVGQNMFMFLMLFGGMAALALDARNSWWFGLLLFALMLAVPAGAGVLVTRWLQRRRERRQPGA